PPSGMFSQVQAKVGDWKARRGLQSEQAGRENLVRNGTQMLYNGTTVAPRVEGLLLWRYNLTLANPSIIAASIIDNSVRGGNIALSQLVTGESSGAISRLLAQARGDQAKVTELNRDRAVVTALSTESVRGSILSELQRLPDRKF